MPAFADSTAADLTAVQDAFAAPDGSTLTLDADIAAASTVLTLAADGVLTLDLAGHDLTLRSIILGTGSNLTITDSNTDAPGTLTADASDGYVPQYEGSACVSSHSGNVAIGTTGATLTINGAANVIAHGGPGTAGIGGARHAAGGTTVIGGHADVVASSGSNSGAIGGGCFGAAGTITITDDSVVHATTGWYGSGIGSGYNTTGGSITINGNSDVTVRGIGSRNVGIGGGYASLLPNLTIGGNTTIHIALDNGTGITTMGAGPITIGGSAEVDIAPTEFGATEGVVDGIVTSNGNPIHITDNATVTATAGHGGSAITGNFGLTIDGNAAVDARSSATAPAIALTYWSEKAMTVGTGASLTVSGGSSTVPALQFINPNAYSVTTVINGSMHVAASATVAIGQKVTYSGNGSIDGLGTIANQGSIAIPSSHVTVASVTGHNYLLTLAAAGGTIPGGVTSVRVLAATAHAAGVTLPTPTRDSNWAFAGWFVPSTDQINELSVLSASSTLTAKWVPYTKSITAPYIAGGLDYRTPVGTTLTVMLAYAPDAGTPTYRWVRDKKVIEGATSKTYVVAPADLGHSIHASVTYHRDGYQNVIVASDSCYGIAAGTLTAGTPAIDGEAAVGSVITANPGDWSPASTFHYRWYADGVAISKAIHSTFIVPASLNGRRISVHIKASAAGYNSSTVLAESEPVSALPPLVPGTVTVTGQAIQRNTLTAKTTPWTPKAALHYQWYSDGRGIVGATSSTYVPTASTVGTQLTVRLTGSAKGYTSQVADSVPTSEVLGAFTLHYLYLSDGKYTVGRTVEVFTLTPNTEVDYAFQWTRTLGGATTDIDGATSRYYKITAADKGALLQSRVTMTKAGYVDLTRTTKNTTKVSTK
jgi:hypothetical protein